jgi:hypothetical protein
MRILCVPDLHIPYEHPKAFGFLARVCSTVRPHRVVLLGDEIDSHAISRWPPDPDLDSAGMEIETALKKLRDFTAVFPRALVCDSNHSRRPLKAALRAGLSRHLVRKPDEVYGTPSGWRRAPRWVLDGVTFLHGDGVAGNAAALEKTLLLHHTSVVLGHAHSRAEVHWLQVLGQRFFAMRCGCLIDPHSPAFAYAADNAVEPVLGCGVIDDGVPTFLPLS